MSEGKRTPGKWHADPAKRMTGFAVAHDGEPNPLAIAITKPKSKYTRGIGDAEAYANARLIASAPELLEALEFVMTAHGEQLDTAFAQAQAAIAKAKGEA